MKKIFFNNVYIFVCLILFPFAALAQAITLDQAFRAAITKTETVPIQSSIVRQYQARVGEAKALILPNISFEGNITRTDTPASSLSDAWQSYTRLTGIQPVFQGGRNLANIHAQQSFEQAQVESLNTVKDNLYSTVAQAYYSLLTAYQDWDNVQSTIKASQDRIKELQRFQKIGRSKRTDTMTAQSQLLILQAQLQTTARTIEAAKDLFAFVTGLDRNTSLVRDIQVPQQLDPVEHYLDQIDAKPDILALQNQLEGAKHNINYYKSGYYPVLGFTGDYYFTRDGSSISNSVNWDVGLGLVFTLYEGGLIRSQVKEAKELAMQSELLLRQQVRQSDSDIRTLYDNLKGTIDQIEILEKAFAVSDETYKAEAKDYKLGIVTNLDVIEALATNLETKTTLDESKHQAMIFAAELGAATNQIKLQ